MQFDDRDTPVSPALPAVDPDVYTAMMDRVVAASEPVKEMVGELKGIRRDLRGMLIMICVWLTILSVVVGTLALVESDHNHRLQILEHQGNER